MPTAWSEVASSPEYQALPPDQKDAARQQYFQQVVAPKVPPEHLEVAKQQFDAANSVKPSGFFDRFGDDLSKRGQNMSDISAQYSADQKSLPRATLAEMGQMGAGVGDFFKEGASSAYNALPQTGQEAVQGIGNFVGKSIPGQMVKNLGAAYNIEAQQHPEVASVLSDVGNIAQAVPVLKGIGTLAEGMPAAGKFIGEMGEDLRAPASPIAPITGPKLPLWEGEAPQIGEGQVVPRTLFQITKANNNLANSTSAAYDKAHELGLGLTDEGSQWAASKLSSDVGELDKKVHPQTMGIINLFEKKAAKGLDLESVENTRKALNKVAYDSNAGANDIGTAKQALKSLDNILNIAQEDTSLIKNGTPESLSALKDARAAHAIEQQHSDIRDIIRKASGNGNKIQSEFKKIYDDEDYYNSFSPENQKIIDNIANPKLGMNALKGAGMFGLGKGSNLWALGGEGIAAATNPIAAGAAGVALPVGTASNVARNFIIRKGADRVLKNIESSSVPLDPLYGKSRTSYLGQKSLPAPAKSLAITARRPMVEDAGVVRPMTDEEWARSANSQNDVNTRQGVGATADMPASEVLSSPLNKARMRGYMTPEEWNIWEQKKLQGYSKGGPVKPSLTSQFLARKKSA